MIKELPHLLDDPVSIKIRQLFAGSIFILCIEDDPEISNLLCDEFFTSLLLTTSRVSTFDKAENAILSDTAYHCWILDLTLERHNDGLDLLKKRPSFPYCVVASNSVSLYDATVAIREGAFGAYDKNAAIVSNASEFKKEVCALATLSFLLHAKKPERFDMFTILLNNFIRSQEEWSRAYCRNERTVRNICEEYTGLTAKQFLSLFHTLYKILICDCFNEVTADFNKLKMDFSERESFYQECAKYVISHLDRVYGKKYLR